MISKLREFFVEQLMVKFDDRLTEESNLFQQGVINSHGYMQILNFLEKEFNVTLTDDELFSNVLVSYSSILDFLKSKGAIN
ncbi:MAG: acyl carrier protein [Candidatus Aminicenantes bacterium]|nr:MAG: acyl carrier protein [Candidatus Aminicenantes bacterium]